MRDFALSSLRVASFNRRSVGTTGLGFSKCLFYKFSLSDEFSVLLLVHECEKSIGDAKVSRM